MFRLTVLAATLVALSILPAAAQGVPCLQETKPGAFKGMFAKMKAEGYQQLGAMMLYGTLPAQLIINPSTGEFTLFFLGKNGELCFAAQGTDFKATAPEVPGKDL